MSEHRNGGAELHAVEQKLQQSWEDLEGRHQDLQKVLQGTAAPDDGQSEPTAAVLQAALHAAEEAACQYLDLISNLAAVPKADLVVRIVHKSE